MPRRVKSVPKASLAGDADRVLCNRFKACSVGVDKFADFRGATSLIREVLGCTLTETPITCLKLFDK
jgi:hypothetical protein